VRPDPGVEREILAAAEAFFAALATRNLDDLLAAFVRDPDVALYGSEVSEVAVGPAALRQFLQRICALPIGPRFTLGEWRVSAGGEVAWLTAPARVAIGEAVADPYRVTLVLERRGGRWLIALFNGSEPVPDRA
jgi:ketosteroid isomerase-like protein